MRFIVLLSMLILGGCSTVIPVTRKFPEPPSDLTMPSKLKTLDPNTTKLSDLLQNANDNYGVYYELKAKNEAWIQWYIEQKKIWNDVN